jgi:hypothetical protein
MIPRLHLVELEDQSWFPDVIRNLATDYLQFMEARMKLHLPVVPLLAEALRESRAGTVIDLCAGGGGPVVALQEELAQAGVPMRFILTDKYPNLPAFARLEQQHAGIEGYRQPVDAAAVPRTLEGFRTIFNAFHHFRPTHARAVLQSAVSARQPIGVFEIPERTLPMVIATMVFTPIIVLLVTPFVRPFRWERLVFTYLIPLVPLTCFWDGLVSQLRAYTPEELRSLAYRLGAVGYTWSTGKTKVPGLPAHVTYLIGQPRAT